MTYQKKTGALMANSHPGSYCGQDAYNDMLVTERHENIFIPETGRIQGIGQSKDDCTQGLQVSNRPCVQENSEWGGINVEYSVRRLTVTECERLQGFQDNWTQIGEEDLETHEWYYIDEDGKRRKVSDSARYRAIGNSIATPFWFYLLRRISAQYERPATMGSLFSGIGGFEYCWEKCNGKGTALFASEIEPFCIAVTKEHFSE